MLTFVFESQLNKLAHCAVRSRRFVIFARVATVIAALAHTTYKMITHVPLNRYLTQRREPHSRSERHQRSGTLMTGLSFEHLISLLFSLWRFDNRLFNFNDIALSAPYCHFACCIGAILHLQISYFFLHNERIGISLLTQQICSYRERPLCSHTIRNAFIEIFKILFFKYLDCSCCKLTMCANSRALLCFMQHNLQSSTCNSGTSIA